MSGVPGTVGPTVTLSVCTSGESWATMFRLAALALVVAGVKVALIEPFATHGKLLMVAVKVCGLLDPLPGEWPVAYPQLRLTTDATNRNHTTGRTKSIISLCSGRRIA